MYSRGRGGPGRNGLVWVGGQFGDNWEAWTHSSSGQRLRSDFWLQYAEDNSEEHYLRMRQSKIGADASLTLSPIEK